MDATETVDVAGLVEAGLLDLDAVKEMKRVQVGNYTFETDLPVKIGDKVLLPTPSWLSEVKGPTWEGFVTSLASDYKGECVKIISIIATKD